MANNPPKPRIFVDADVLFAGAASPNEHSASLVILRMAEITLIEAVTSKQVITEVERNLEEKMPAAMPAFQMLVSRCLHVVSDPTVAEIKALSKAADRQGSTHFGCCSAGRLCLPYYVQYSTFSTRRRICHGAQTR